MHYSIVKIFLFASSIFVFSLEAVPKESRNSSWFRISDIYASLNDQEAELVNAYPNKMWKAYWLSWEAQHKCDELYTTSRTNDESDACRHFMWAGMLLNQFNTKVVINNNTTTNTLICNKSDHALSGLLSVKVLTAHEAEPSNPIKEKKMDLHNNKKGFCASERLILSGTFSVEQLFAEYKTALASNQLIVLKPYNSKVTSTIAIKEIDKLNDKTNKAGHQ